MPSATRPVNIPVVFDVLNVPLEVIVEPTIISKPLVEGGNFDEVFSPLIFVQQYDDDSDLVLYFEKATEMGLRTLVVF